MTVAGAVLDFHQFPISALLNNALVAVVAQYKEQPSNKQCRPNSLFDYTAPTLKLLYNKA